MKKIFLLLFLFIYLGTFAQQASPFNCQHTHQEQNSQLHQNPSVLADENGRSDTIDLLKITINLNITDFTTDTIRGNTAIRFAPRMNNVSTLDLDLLQLLIDSIKINSSVLTYAYNDTLLHVTLPFVHNTTDTSILTVYYHGVPQVDPSGWGGFYFSGTYAYNLGVGFGEDPHCFGRAWFPCFDNFVERSKYEFNISTNGGKLAYCNGMLMHDTTVTGLRTRKWVLNQEIPSYLASVSICTYTQVNQTFNSMSGPIPIVLTAVPADTVNMKSSFIHLTNALQGFEARYGPYRWPRVGYCLVPFNSGAMEHATNISYPKACATGTLTYEAGIMAHELSHHWWGDLATCHNEGQMWLNEGWASYSEHIFREWYYGYASYINGIKLNHSDMVHYAHLREGGYLIEDSIPHAYTYGDHVYLKGADLAHTLRGYLGDSVFFAGLQYHLSQSQYKDVTSLDFRDNLITATGQTAKLTSYFNDWILHPGWPQFSVDSFTSVVNGSNYDVTVYLDQKLKGAPNYYTNVPLDLTFRNNSWATQTKVILASGQNCSATFTIPFDPSIVIVDVNDKISDAVTTDTKVLNAVGNNLSIAQNGRMQVIVQTIADSAYIHIDHNWVAPDPFKSWGNPYRLTDHYWLVNGIFPSGFYAKATVSYDARALTTGGGGNMDNIIITANNLEDSIVLLYRRDAADDWHLYPYYTKTMGPMTDKYGTITIDSLKQGEYTIGIKDHAMGINTITTKNSIIKAYPNPASDELNVEINSNENKIRSVKLIDATGKSVAERQLTGTETKCKFDVRNLKSGVYYLVVSSGSMRIGSMKVMVTH